MDIKDFLLGYAAGQGQGGSDPVLEPVTVTPSTSQQVIPPPEGADGISQATVSAVTKELLAQLDADFTAGNIKQGVDILGLLGTFAGVPSNCKVFKVDIASPITTPTIVIQSDADVLSHKDDAEFVIAFFKAPLYGTTNNSMIASIVGTSKLVLGSSINGYGIQKVAIAPTTKDISTSAIDTSTGDKACVDTEGNIIFRSGSSSRYDAGTYYVICAW